jgi:hypothetical protein
MNKKLSKGVKKMKIKLSKSQWEMAGRKAGWMKNTIDKIAVVSPIQSNHPRVHPSGKIIYRINGIMKGLDQVRNNIKSIIDQNPNITKEQLAQMVSKASFLDINIGNSVAQALDVKDGGAVDINMQGSDYDPRAQWNQK